MLLRPFGYCRFVLSEHALPAARGVHYNSVEVLRQRLAERVRMGAGDGGVCHPQPFQRKAQYLCPAWHYLVGHQQAFAVHTRCDAAALAARGGAEIQHLHTRAYLRRGNRRHGRGFLNIEQPRYVVRVIAYAVCGLIEHKALPQYFGTLNFISKQAFQLLRACLEQICPNPPHGRLIVARKEILQIAAQRLAHSLYELFRQPYHNKLQIPLQSLPSPAVYLPALFPCLPAALLCAGICLASYFFRLAVNLPALLFEAYPAFIGGVHKGLYLRHHCKEGIGPYAVALGAAPFVVVYNYLFLSKTHYKQFYQYHFLFYLVYELLV